MAVTRVAAMLDPYILALLGTVGLAAFLPANLFGIVITPLLVGVLIGQLSSGTSSH